MDSIVSAAELGNVLTRLNPWWFGRFDSVPPFRRIAQRRALTELKQESRRAVMLAGPRRVGKSTILRQVAQDVVEDNGRDPRSVVYVSMDHPILKLAGLRRVLAHFHASIHPQGSPTLLLLDEAQAAMDWELEVKALVDHAPEYRVLATGSALGLSTGAGDSGAGRWITIHVPTLSFHEFLTLRGVPIQSDLPIMRPSDLARSTEFERLALLQGLESLLPAFRKYLLLGGFPETACIHETSRAQLLLREDVIDRVLHRDMASFHGVRDIPAMEKLFVYLCIHLGGIVKVDRVASELQVTRPTVERYLHLLEHSYLVARLEGERSAGKAALKPTRKYYLTDAALRNAVLLLGEEILNDPTEMGKIVEAAVIRHLQAFHYPHSVTPRLSFWTDTRTKSEVDVIVRAGVTIPIEIKYRADARAAALVQFCRSEPCRVAFVISRSHADCRVEPIDDTSTTLVTVPAHVFLFLLGHAEWA